MTGVDIVAQLLRSDSAVTSLVPLARIKEGQLPLNVKLPALLLRTVSVVDGQPLKRSPATLRADRIAVTVRAGSYREQEAVLKAVRTCCAGRVVDIPGQRVAILPSGTGPDVVGPNSSFERTADFRLRLKEPS